LILYAQLYDVSIQFSNIYGVYFGLALD